MEQPLQSCKLGTQVYLQCDVHTLFLSLSCDCCRHIKGKDLLPGQPAARTGCYHWPQTSDHCGISPMQGPNPLNRTYFSRALVPSEFTLWVCCLWRWLGGGVSTWSEAVHLVCWPWGLLRDAGKGQPPPVFFPGPSNISNKATCRWLLLLLDLELPRRVQAMNQGQLLLVPGLGQLSKRYGAHWGQMLLVWEILGKSEAWAKTSHLYEKATENSLCGPKSWVE